MAIGDAIAVLLGTGAVSRQPAAGVEEKITMLVKDQTSDAIQMFDGTNNVQIIQNTDQTDTDLQDVTTTRVAAENMGMMITNTVFFRKIDTSDRVYLGGVQTNV